MSSHAKQFQIGQLLSTPGVLREIGVEEMMAAFYRHSMGDWGDVCPEDWRSNDHAICHGLRLLSAYHSKSGQKFWIITEADRSATTILLPEEY